MSTRKRYTFTLQLEAIDENALRAAAIERAKADAILPDWQPDSIEDSLVMLLDPATLTGCEIDFSECEAHHQ